MAIHPELCEPVTEWMISSWLVELCIKTYILSCIQYTHGIHTCVMKRCIHSQRINSYHSCKWDCSDFMTYLLLNKSWKRGWFTYLKMNLNMWLTRRARMMAARVMVLVCWTVRSEGEAYLSAWQVPPLGFCNPSSRYPRRPRCGSAGKQTGIVCCISPMPWGEYSLKWSFEPACIQSYSCQHYKFAISCDLNVYVIVLVESWA